MVPTQLCLQLSSIMLGTFLRFEFMLQNIALNHPLCDCTKPSIYLNEETYVFQISMNYIKIVEFHVDYTN